MSQPPTMDPTLTQILNTLMAANERAALLQQENAQLRELQDHLLSAQAAAAAPAEQPAAPEQPSAPEQPAEQSA